MSYAGKVICKDFAPTELSIVKFELSGDTMLKFDSQDKYKGILSRLGLPEMLV